MRLIMLTELYKVDIETADTLQLLPQTKSADSVRIERPRKRDDMMMRLVISVSLVLIGLQTALGFFNFDPALPSCPADLEMDLCAKGGEGSPCATGKRILDKILTKVFKIDLCAEGHECCQSASGIGLCNAIEVEVPCDSANGFVESPTLGCLKYSPPGLITSYNEAQTECQNTGTGNDLVSITTREEFLELVDLFQPPLDLNGIIALGITLLDQEACTFITANGEIITQDSDLWINFVTGSSLTFPQVCGLPDFVTSEWFVVISAIEDEFGTLQYVIADIIEISLPGVPPVILGYICQQN